MKLSTFLSISSIVGLVYGLLFLIVPGVMLTLHGEAAEADNLMQIRFFGSALVGWALIVWLGRHVRDDRAIRAMLVGSATGFGLGTLISLWGVMSGLMNAMGWSSVIVYLLLLAGAVYFLAPAHRLQPA